MSKGRPNKGHTPEFMQMVVETMQKEKLSYPEMARQYGIDGHQHIQDYTKRRQEPDKCSEIKERITSLFPGIVGSPGK